MILSDETIHDLSESKVDFEPLCFEHLVYMILVIEVHCIFAPVIQFKNNVWELWDPDRFGQQGLKPDARVDKSGNISANRDGCLKSWIPDQTVLS